MTHNIPLNTPFISGLSSGLQMFGAHGHFDDDFDNEQELNTIKHILSIPNLWSVRATSIWIEEEIELQFN